MAKPLKRYTVFLDDNNAWVFAGDYDKLEQAQHYTGLTVHCLIVDTETGTKYERLSPRGTWLDFLWFAR